MRTDCQEVIVASLHSPTITGCGASSEITLLGALFFESTLIRISLKMFPRVSLVRDIQVLFTWDLETQVTAEVHGFTFWGTGSSGVIDVDVKSPIGSNVREGIPTIVVFHRSFGQSYAAVLPDEFAMTDTVPALSILSDVSGPKVGDDVVEVQIARFPHNDISIFVATSTDESRIFLGQCSTSANSDVCSLATNNENTNTRDVTIRTPEFESLHFRRLNETVNLQVVGDLSVIFFVQASDNAMIFVKFSYLVEDVMPKLVLNSFRPSGLPGEVVNVKIEYFEFPTEVSVAFNNSDPLPDQMVQVLPSSNKHMTWLRFWSGANVSDGIYEIFIAPKAMDRELKTLSFVFEILDASIPEMVSPLANYSYFQQTKMPDFWIMSKQTPQEVCNVVLYLTQTIQASGVLSTKLTMNQTELVSTDKPGQYRLRGQDKPPIINQPTNFVIVISLELNNGHIKNASSFDFAFLDANELRIVKMTPNVLPASTEVSGRKMTLNSEVLFVIANFPQYQGEEQVGVNALTVELMNSSKLATVISVRHTVSCSQVSIKSGCSNRTTIVLNIPGIPNLSKL